MTVGIVPGNGGMNLLDSQTFTSSTTYTVPSGAKSLIVEGIGAGGGGGAGGRFNDSPYKTASGGGGGPWERTFLDVSEIGGAGSSVTVTIAAGGAGGTGVSTIPTSGGDGAAAGLSRFGPVYFLGGRGGEGADVSTQTSVAGYAPFMLGGDAAEVVPRTFGSNSNGIGRQGFRGGGGGGCGGYDDGTASLAGFAGGSSVANPDMNTSGVYRWLVPEGGGGAAGAVATNGTAGTSGAGGGGGGARRTAGTAGAGGNGGSPGGGGGGGGVLYIAAGTSGAGGTGGNAQIKIWVYG